MSHAVLWYFSASILQTRNIAQPFYIIFWCSSCVRCCWVSRLHSRKAPLWLPPSHLAPLCNIWWPNCDCPTSYNYWLSRTAPLLGFWFALLWASGKYNWLGYSNRGIPCIYDCFYVIHLLSLEHLWAGGSSDHQEWDWIGEIQNWKQNQLVVAPRSF